MYELKRTLLQKIIVLETGLPSTSCRRADFLFEKAVSGFFSISSPPLQSTSTWTCNLIINIHHQNLP